MTHNHYYTALMSLIKIGNSYPQRIKLGMMDCKIIIWFKAWTLGHCNSILILTYHNLHCQVKIKSSFQICHPISIKWCNLLSAKVMIHGVKRLLKNNKGYGHHQTCKVYFRLFVFLLSNLKVSPTSMTLRLMTEKE